MQLQLCTDGSKHAFQSLPLLLEDIYLKLNDHLSHTVKIGSEKVKPALRGAVLMFSSCGAMIDSLNKYIIQSINFKT